MYIKSFIANKKTILSLEEKIKTSKLSHAMLIFAKEGLGVNHFAKLLAGDILNVDKSDFHLIETDSHPQVQIIKGSGASGQIKVESVRDINSNVNFSSLSGDKRVVIIQNCENFNQSSANALLKNLEEPKDDITYILTSTDSSAILSTIRSRCQIFTLSQPSNEECREYFNGEKNENLSTLIDIYDGNIGMVKNCIESPKRMEILQKAIKAQEYIRIQDQYSLAKLLFNFNKKKDEFSLFLNDIEYICNKNLNDNNINVLNAITKSRNAMDRNANLALIVQNFIIATKK